MLLYIPECLLDSLELWCTGAKCLGLWSLLYIPVSDSNGTHQQPKTTAQYTHDLQYKYEYHIQLGLYKCFNDKWVSVTELCPYDGDASHSVKPLKYNAYATTVYKVKLKH